MGLDIRVTLMIREVDAPHTSSGSGSILWRWRRGYILGAIHPRYPDQLHGRHIGRVRPSTETVVIIIALPKHILLVFIISQKRMRWRAIIFGEAHSTLLTCPRFQSMSL